MATTRSTPVRKAWRSLTWLMVITLGLTALLGAGVAFWGWRWAPKLALDLQGGTQVILTPALEDGQEPSRRSSSTRPCRSSASASMPRGVSEAQISTQGNNIVVEIPGELDDQTRERIQASAKLEFRPGAAGRRPVDRDRRHPVGDARPMEPLRLLRRHSSPHRA